MIGELDQGDDIAHALLGLTDSEQPGRPLPERLQGLMPQPMRTLTDWQRFTHQDVDDLDPAARKWELLRLRIAAAEMEPRQIPTWVLRRLAVLGGMA